MVQVVYSFTTVAAPDTTAPTASGYSPAVSAIDVAIDTNIVVHVTDAGAGVDTDTIVMTVEGSLVTPVITGTAADYTLTYNPAADFGNLQVVNVTVDASDLASTPNAMVQVVYSFTLTKATPTVNVTGGSFTYDGVSHAVTGFGYGVGGIGDVLTPAVTFSYSGTGSTTYGPSTTPPTNVGTYLATASFVGNANYTSASNSAALTITPATLTLTITATGVNKTYDGTTTATVTLSDNRVAGDVFTDSYTSASFSDKNVGTGKTVNVSGISISGTDAGNYTFNTTTSTTANITARTLTVSLTGVNKTYDGTTTATVTGSDNRVTDDVFTDSYTSASFSDKNVGTGKTVSVTGISISGAGAGNYTLGNTTANTTADITAATLTITASSGTMTYGGTVPTITPSYSGLQAGDSAPATLPTCSTTATSTSPVGSYPSSCSGAVDANYTIGYTGGSVSVTPATLTLTITATGVNKTYDGTTTATVTLSDNRVAGDVFTDSYTSASFSDKNVGTGKTVNVSGISISGTDAGNYTFNTTTSTTANITARTLTVSLTGVNKTYDGTTTATVTGSDNRVTDDVFTDSYTSASFSDKNVGTGKTVSVTGISISGAGAGNYTLGNTTANTTADITAATLTITASSGTMTYGGTVPTITPSYSGLQAGDSAPATLPTCSTTATSTSPVGSYPSSCSGAVDANYTIGYTAGSVSVTVNNPVPSITTLDPTSATAGGAAFTLTVNGANFVNGAIVRWNGTDRTTTYDSSTQLRAIILATDITAAEVPLVTVFNPTPGGGISDEKPFFITTTGALVASSTTETGIDLTITNGSVTAATTGTGTVTVAQYASDPGGTPTFTATGQYFDVQISGSFTSVTIDICELASG
ncbi:MAG: hypothetical protein IMZ50_15735, partial [Candidatus Atribacteria bacterium]|nr:hypothetical protein [Candidatus Atribacteria bacterium]